MTSKRVLYRVFLAKRDQIILYYEDFHCGDIPFGDLSCHLSTWTFLVVLFGLLMLLLLIALLVFFNVRVHSLQVRNGKADNVTDL